MNQDEIYQSENMDMDVNWEVERHLLETKIKDLENALDKSKKNHQKFVDDVIESEDLRNQEFDRVKRELTAINKRQLAEIRQLTKDKKFYEATCNEMMKERERAENSNQSSSVFEPSLQTKSSTTEGLKSGSIIPSTERKSTRNVSKYKISTKLFEDNRKLKDKISKLTKANATLRLQVKQLDNFKTKTQNRKQQVTADQQEMEDLLVSTKRTNSQIFNRSALSKLDQFNQINSNVEHSFQV